MSLLNDASLVMIPSGYKDGTLYSAKPTNGDGDFTFSRGSNLAATRVNSEGLIEKGRENILLQSNSFDTTWVTSNVSVTSGQSGYDGSSDAWLLTENSATAEHKLIQNPSFGGVCTISVYAKANTRDWLWLRGVLSGVNVRAWFNLSTGTLGSTSGAVIDHKIEAVSGATGWYRCSMTLNHTAAFEHYIGISNADLTASYAGNGTGSIYIQDAQLEVGLVATDYIETTTTTEQAGILEDMPRLDYSGGATCPSLLLEPQRSNFVTQSEYLSDLSVPERATITSNADTSPEGVVNASSFVEDSTTGRHRMQTNSISVTSGTTYTFSMFAKIKSGNRLLCVNADFLFNTRVYFDLVNGDVEGVDSGSASIEDYGNGWYRCTATGTATATRSSIVYFGLEDGTSDNGYAGDGISGHYWYGAQIEEGSYPTSYIPTYGSSVTRSADSCSKTGISSLIGQTEGVLYAEVDLNVKIESGSPVSGILTTNNNVSDLQNCIILGVERNASGTNSIYCLVQVSNVTQAALFGSSITSGNYKIALAYKANDFALYVNGVQVATDTSGSVPTTSQVLIGTRRNSDNFTLADRVSQAIVFPTRLTNDELASLTTI